MRLSWLNNANRGCYATAMRSRYLDITAHRGSFGKRHEIYIFQAYDANLDHYWRTGDLFLFPCDPARVALLYIECDNLARSPLSFLFAIYQGVLRGSTVCHRLRGV